jgi:hypothetical protein
MMNIGKFFCPFATAALMAQAPAKIQAPAPSLVLDKASASHFAKLAIRCAVQEYPNKPDHVLGEPGDLKTQKEFHPAFYGCYDWHSSVHGHWLLARLLRQFPNMPEANQIITILDRHLSPDTIKVELAYFDNRENRAFERPYGWAWLLKLSAELESSSHPKAKEWAGAVRPLAKEIRNRFMDYLPKLTYPIRTGVHSNTAYAMSLALDYAKAVKDSEFEAMIAVRALVYYSKDRAVQLNYEPSGEDFISPALEEAALMAKVLTQPEFQKWVIAFLPNFKRLPIAPAEVSDRSDPRIAHLDGLNMSRARNLYALVASLPAKDAKEANLLEIADAHAKASLPFVASGNYEGEHWLATFAVHMLEARR